MIKDKSIIEVSILRTALRLLQDKKYRTTNVTALSRQAGVSRSSFYRCFRNKEEVLCRLLQQELSSSSVNDAKENGTYPVGPDILREILAHEEGDWLLKDNSAAENSLAENTELQRLFHTVQSNDAVLELYYTNGYYELAREQAITLFAGQPENTAHYYKKVFKAGGILSLYEAWKKRKLLQEVHT